MVELAVEALVVPPPHPFEGRPLGKFQVHYYMNSTTGVVDYTYDYKVKLAGKG